MIRFLPVILCFSVVAAPAAARGPAFVGNWAISAKACKAKGRHDGRVRVTRRKIQFHETGCDFTKVEAGRKPGVYYVTAICRGEGEKWTRDDMYVVRGKGKFLVIVDKGGAGFNYVRCQ
jgi:hypothetical protein